MVRNFEELKALEKVMSSLYEAQCFELFVFDTNIMTRKMLNNEFPSPPFHTPQVFNRGSDIIMQLRSSEKRPIMVWDLDEKSTRIEEWISKIVQIQEETNLIWFLSSNQIDKARVVPLLKQGATGFLVKPWNYESLMKYLRPLLFKE